MPLQFYFSSDHTKMSLYNIVTQNTFYLHFVEIFEIIDPKLIFKID